MARVIDIDRGWSLIVRRLGSTGQTEEHAAVGFLAGVNEEIPETVPGSSYAAIALFNEFGTRTVPARPFMRRAFDAHRAKYERMMELGARKMSAGEMTAQSVLGEVALENQKDVRESIRDAKTWAIPNAPSTIAQKGSSSPLIDTGALRNAVAWEIRSGGRAGGHG